MQNNVYRVLKLVMVIGISAMLFINNQAVAARHALVIGNSNYKSAPLANPKNDALDVSTRLSQLGFDVTTKIDVDQKSFVKAIREFGQKLGRGDVGLFYFAGHGMQINGKNYLIPINTDIGSEDEVEYSSVDAGRILSKMETAGNALNIVVLDACRNNPFARSFRSSSRGLARVDAPTGSIIVYATAPNQVAADGDGRNGLFTQHLLKYIDQPDISLNQLLIKTRASVIAASNGQQVPWSASSLTQEFFFQTPGKKTGSGQSARQNMSDLSAEELARWQGVRECQSLAELKDFVRDFPGGTFTAVAQQCIKDMEVNSEQPLYVDTFPSNATVRVLNIGPQYHYGIKLNPGRYQLEVSQRGYETQTSWFNLSAQNRQLTVKLKEKPKHQDVIYQVKGISFTFKAIPSGSFDMGSINGNDNEKPVHRVTIKPFKLMEHEVTWAMYQPCIDAGACPDNSDDEGWGKGNRPMIKVSWSDINQFYIPWLNSQTGQNFRLPSEAEWEYAARAGSTTKYSWGDYVGTNKANCKECGSRWDGSKTAPVKAFSSNDFGLYDMHGNVWEWVQDCYNDGYHGAPDDGSAWMSGGCEHAVLRGGSWSFKPDWLRSANRFRYGRTDRNNVFGFRLAQD